jgi:hypothetical protein
MDEFLDLEITLMSYSEVMISYSSIIEFLPIYINPSDMSLELIFPFLSLSKIMNRKRIYTFKSLVRNEIIMVRN